MSEHEPQRREKCAAERGGILATVRCNVILVFRSPAVWIPLLMLAASTAVFRCTDVDLELLRPFVGNIKAPEPPDRWPLTDLQPWKTLYDWGVYPAWFLGCGGLFVWIASFRWPGLAAWRDEGLFYVLLLILGPGILVNGIVKPCWQRPRPNAIRSFGGNRDFVPVWNVAGGQEEASFPSGHASMGFYLMAPAFVYYRRRPGLAAGFLLLGIVYGALIGLARMVAGGHFPSDVLWAGGFVYFTALLLATPFRFGGDWPPFWQSWVDGPSKNP